MQPEVRIISAAAKYHGERLGTEAAGEDIAEKTILKTALTFLLGSIEKFCL